MKQETPSRKVLILDADVHSAVKATAAATGMKFQALGNSVLRAWHRGERFLCPQVGMESKAKRPTRPTK